MKRKGSARKNILMLAAMSGGEIASSVAKDICGTNQYYNRVVAIMKKKDEIEIVYGQKPRTILIKQNGAKALEEEIPYVVEMYDARMFRYKKDRSERHAVISQTIYNAQLADIDIYPNEKAELNFKGELTTHYGGYGFYTPREFKSTGEKELHGSRMHGIIVGKDRVFCVYNFMNKNLKYRRMVEQSAQDFIGRKFRCKQDLIFYCDNFSLAEKILHNQEIEEKWRNKRNVDLVVPSVGGYIVPNGEKGMLYLQMILYPEIMEKIKEMAARQEKKEIVNCLTLTLETCKRISLESREVALLCTDEQREYLEKLNGNPNISICQIQRSQLEKVMEKYLKEGKG